MNILKKYDYIYKFILFIIFLTTIETIINLIIPLPTTINKIIILVSLTIYIFITNIKRGKKIEKKAYLEGLKIGLSYIITLYILGIPFTLFKLPLKRLIYYLIIIIISITSTIIGINKKTL